MAQYGLGNYLYEVYYDGKAANFSFRDPEDAHNVAEVAVDPKDFPEGIKDADSRQVADLAYSQVSDKLNKTRDERLKKEAADAEAEKLDSESKQRAAAEDFFEKSQELTLKPVATEKDKDTGVTYNVFNTAEPKDEKKK